MQRSRHTPARNLQYMQPHHQINHTNVNYRLVLTNVTLAKSNCTLPDDGYNTETCWICFNVNFNINLKQLFCASFGNKTLMSKVYNHVCLIMFYSSTAQQVIEFLVVFSDTYTPSQCKVVGYKFLSLRRAKWPHL